MSAPLRTPHTWTPALARWRDAVLSVDLESLALFRICLGGLLLADLVVWARDAEMHLTDQGVIPRELWHVAFAELPSFHTWGGSLEFELTLLALAALPALAFTLGWHTRVAQVLTWAFWISLQHRNPMILNGGDEVMRLVLFWSVFLPLNAR